jgi:hypothetical protein
MLNGLSELAYNSKMVKLVEIKREDINLYEKIAKDINIEIKPYKKDVVKIIGKSRDLNKFIEKTNLKLSVERLEK